MKAPTELDPPGCSGRAGGVNPPVALGERGVSTPRLLWASGGCEPPARQSSTGGFTPPARPEVDSFGLLQKGNFLYSIAAAVFSPSRRRTVYVH
jgi:hypothetical protein